MAKKAAPRKRVHPAGKHAPKHADELNGPADRPVAAASDVNSDYDPEIDGPEDIDDRPVPTIKVRALKDGYYDDKRRRAGDVFRIRVPYKGLVTDKNGKETEQTINEFSARWMRKVPASTPERITTGKQILRDHHDREMAARRGLPDNPTGAEKVLE